MNTNLFEETGWHVSRYAPCFKQALFKLMSHCAFSGADNNNDHGYQNTKHCIQAWNLQQL